MSFYDSASLVFLPSGGAGKDGKAYSIKPVPEYGNELITNGGFDTDSDWVKAPSGASISGGKAILNSSSDTYIYQDILTAGKTYRVEFDAEVTSGSFYVGENGQVTSIYGVGSYTNEVLYFDVTSSARFIFRRTGSGTLNVSIDNVSVKEVIVDGDFTFSRGSNLTATRVDSNGLIEKGRENLLKQSNQFNTTWTTLNASVTSGQSGYDGSSDAWLLENTANSGRIYQSITTSGVNTFSVYVKAGTTDWVALYGQTSPNQPYVYFDLTNGVVGTKEDYVIHSSITSVGNGWYRISIAFDEAVTDLRIFPAAGNAALGVTGDNIYIQDAQLEQGLVATEYIESGASTGKAGILEDSPRFDYSGGASCPSLLLEPSRTNIVPISEGIPEDINAVTLTENYGTSPEGLQNSLKVQKDGVSSNDRILPIDNYNATLVSGTSYFVSAFVKNIDVDNGGFTTIGCRISGGSLFRLAYEWTGSSLAKNTTTGSSTGTRVNEICEDYGNGWWRIGFGFEADGTTSNIEIDVDRQNSSATTSIETYGWQLEQGSYPTSYIPNHSGGSVTRNGENKYLQNSSILSSGDGTIFWELDEFDTNTSADGFNQIIYVSKNSDSSLNDTIYLDEYIGNFRVYLRKNNILILRSETGYADLRGSKIAISWNSSGAKIFIDGVENASYVGDASNTFEFFGHDRPYNDAIKSSLKLKQEMYFPTALSDVELEILTGTSYESFAEMATALNYTIYE